ncbi:MAG: ClbS/DfsB family four-helix bundle protein, partial [Muribaculaceae bacterium]|nr:ClbS/DfsB family four-helix bundle protein [Muribaculaceae bacterium]
DEYRRNYHEMDKMLVEKHQGTPLEQASHLLQQTQEEMLSLAESFSEEELFTKGYYKNTYTTTMAAYFVSVTTSPYGQAVKLLKTHQKNCRK